MAKYTFSVREVLQYNKHDNESLTDIDDVYAIAARSIFNVDGINAISSQYRQALITSLALKYMNEESALETMPLFQIALNEKLYNYASYINLIYENLDKQVFASYRVRRVENAGETENAKSATGSVNTDRDVSSTDTETLNTQHDTEGTDTTTVTKSGSETHIRSGNDDVIKSGSEVQKNSGTDTTTDDGYQDNISSSASGNYTNGVQIMSDTPMGSLQNIRTPGGDVDDNTSTTEQFDEGRDMDIYGFGGDRGYDYTTGQSYNYMSAATETDQTVTNVENGNDKSINHNTSGTVHGLNVETTYGKTAAGQTDERKDSTEYHSKDTTSYGVNENGNTDTRQDVTLVSHDTTVSDTGTNTKVNSTSDETAQTTSNEETATGSHSDTTDETEYTLNWEMLYKSMPLLNKLWTEVFDDLFLWLY